MYLLQGGNESYHESKQRIRPTISRLALLNGGEWTMKYLKSTTNITSIPVLTDISTTRVGTCIKSATLIARTCRFGNNVDMVLLSNSI